MFLFDKLFHILFPMMFEQSYFDVFWTFQNTSYNKILSDFGAGVGSFKSLDKSESYIRMMHYS